METTIQSIATGNAKSYTLKNKVFSSAYKKNNYKEFSHVNFLGLEEDIQVDKKFHGGYDKAIHIGSTKHFEQFKVLNNKELDMLAIGCNILIDKYDEKDICLGDIYTIGEVQIEVTQPRQPCWKIGALFDKETSRFISKYGATGWYVRVLKEGRISTSDKMILEKRVSNITIKELTNYLKTPPKDTKLQQSILENTTLAQSYKDDFQKLLISC